MKLFKDLAQKHPDLVDLTEYYLADKGYDGIKHHVHLWDKHRINTLLT